MNRTLIAFITSVEEELECIHLIVWIRAVVVHESLQLLGRDLVRPDLLRDLLAFGDAICEEAAGQIVNRGANRRRGRRDLAMDKVLAGVFLESDLYHGMEIQEPGQKAGSATTGPNESATRSS